MSTTTYKKIIKIGEVGLGWFPCEWEAREAKKLVTESGIFSKPEKKKDKTFPVETVDSVKRFYKRDDISRVMPGLKDCISVKQDNGKREHVHDLTLARRAGRVEAKRLIYQIYNLLL